MRLRQTLWIEGVGDEVLILDAPDKVVHRLFGSAADAARRLNAGESIDPYDPGLLELREAGLIDDTSGSPTRRSVLATGAMVLGAGVVSVALPPAAAASSVTPSPTPTPTPTALTVTSTGYDGFAVVTVSE